MSHTEAARLASSRERVGRAWGRLNAERWAALEVLGAGTYLDVGCSSGAYVQRLTAAGRTAWGVDLLPEAAWHGQPIVCGDARALPFDHVSVDVAFAFEVLEHVPAPSSAAAELARVARRAIVVSVPNCAPAAALDGAA